MNLFTINAFTGEEVKAEPANDDICANGDGLYADKSRDCKFYFKCLFTGTRFSRKIETACPNNMYFNDVERKCTTKNIC